MVAFSEGGGLFVVAELGFDLLDLVVREDWGCVGGEVFFEACAEDVFGEVGFELAFADEEDDGVEESAVEGEKISEAFDVAVVLAEGILKAGFVAVDALAPGGVVFVAEDPALHVFGFDDEDAEFGDKDMIDLGGAVFGLEDEVVDAAVDGFVEGEPHSEGGDLFAEPAFEEIEHLVGGAGLGLVAGW